MTSILRHNRLALLGGGVLLLMIGISVAASWIASMDPAMMQPRMRLTPPGEAFLLGTDALGRDVYSRVVHGSRMSLAIGALVVVITIAIGTLIGLVAGASRIMDRILMRIMDGVMAIPGILLAVALVSLFGASLVSVVIAIAVPEIPRVVRLVRSVVLSVREEPYVEAAVGLGVPYPKVVWRHILPNCFAPLIVQASYVFAAAILLEAVLGFLGVGFPPEIPTFGNILAEARPVFQRAPWATVAPGLLLAVTVLAVNLLGDGLRDSLDPKLARRAND
ncbi:ABC transporter permease [Bordetella bronchiseptica]|uniref:ABC transporter permease n=1 Tax=Bordetella bronchiseptica TaxID=518 RepID=UPI00081D0B69|nr:ABC transporter permease [Bordetella bronchiseptica]AOB26493.1 peptide ABC transporter permease [Bordetella bronchiseptica]AZW43795.1 ABC transporter permease [Bordetella bronchiseptica]